ncbi:THUMP domain-containing protein 2 [Anoplopoma fimbria]|uniref:THUMP domain-containing protein 2 n=1 Tax=Anoplopoma fimbria TaxID=229290 RepID=UPI0023ECD9AB|nr:THUMP domain-containing protein 2 [Anoplopoma fimbria]
MSEPDGERRSVRYFCTAGSGMERFLTGELTEKLQAEQVCQMPGKVLFSSSAGINRVSELKAAERLFLFLKRDSPVRLSPHINPAKAASVLQSRVLGDIDQWTGAAMTWSRLQGELAGRRTAVKTSSTAPGVTQEREEGRQRETGQRGTCGVEARMLETKRKRDEEEKESSGDTNAEKRKKSESKRHYEEEDGTKGISETDSDDRGSVCVQATAGRDHDVERSCRKTDDTEEDFAVENVEHEPSAHTSLSFRISCKCTGSLSRYFSTQDVSRVIGGGLSRLLGWKADLKNPQLEVNVSLSDDYFLLGFPLTRCPLANRSYMKTTGLRSTVAWAMASLAQIQPGSCVVDPMCGVGTILIEAAQEHKDVRFLGLDIDDGQLQRANENVEFAELGNRIQLLKASSMMLPLPTASVDAVVCDLPFGRKFGTKTNMAANLPLILTEMERVLCIGGSLVLLLSPQLSCLLKKLLTQKDAGPTSNQETEPRSGIQDCPSPSPSSTKQQTFQIHQEVKSPPTQETGPQSGLQSSPPPPLCSLKHLETVRVSLGAIDGLIHKYVKTDT